MKQLAQISSLGRSRWLSKPILFAAAMLLAGCGGNAMENMAAGDRHALPHQKFPIHVRPAMEEMDIVVAPHVFAISREDKMRVASFTSAYKHVGHGQMWIVAPEGSDNAAASLGASAEISKVMVEQGLSPHDIKMRSYRTSDSNAPITIKFKVYETKTRPCANWNENVAFEPLNGSTPNFGCATQANWALLVEDPHDLMGPRHMDPADPARRETILNKYREGQGTHTVRGQEESGRVSEIDE